MPDVLARTIVWLASPLCDLDDGTMIDLRSRPEIVEQIDRVQMSER